MVRCRIGERDAFTELVTAWHGPLRTYLRGMVGSTHVADDLAQETWIAVLRGLPRLKHPERFAAWLFTIARRTLADHLRRTYAAPATPLATAAAAYSEPSGAGGPPESDPLELLLDHLTIEAGLSELPLPEREVLILFHLDDLPLATCAAVLDLPSGTVKSRLFRARRLLRAALTEKGYEA